MNQTNMRCAIYTRKSSEEGLEQGFNSLDAQHEACSAYITSQRHEGWTALNERYDDGGQSGGTMDRPALMRLLQDIEARRVDMVVVYKIDRLTRSLADFARIVEQLDRANCSFVSVTQSFNTSTSMGRLTLNVLLSFAQFEREVTAERIRDKIRASRKRGLWMGGTLPLGYDPHPDPAVRTLVINEQEAKRVHEIFSLYDQLGCLRLVEEEVHKRGYRSKSRRLRSGTKQGNRPFSRSMLHYMLRNPVYIGKARHKSTVYDGQHPPILNSDLWQRVQDRLDEAARKPTRKRERDRRRAIIRPPGPNARPLTGKLRDGNGEPLTPTHTKKGTRRYGYYASLSLIRGGRKGAAPDDTALRLPAQKLEEALSDLVYSHLKKQLAQGRLLARMTAGTMDRAGQRLAGLASGKDERSATGSDLLNLIDHGVIERDRVHLTLEAEAVARVLGIAGADVRQKALAFDGPLSLVRRNKGMTLTTGSTDNQPDPHLVSMLARAWAWRQALEAGTTMKDLAEQEKVSTAFIRTRLPLAFIAPALQARILNGDHNSQITLTSLIRQPLPLSWEDQNALFS